MTDLNKAKAIPVEKIKVGVLYISDPVEGSGYSYTHDLGIQGMQSNLGLSDAQIERKIVDDSDKDATQKAIEEFVADGCNVIFATSWANYRVVCFLVSLQLGYNIHLWPIIGRDECEIY